MKDRLILLDVDGVLAPFTRPSGDYQPHKLATSNGTFNIFLNPNHGPALLKLAAEADADLVWATMWDHEANKMIAPRIGLPELPVIEMVQRHPRDMLVHHKTPLVAAYTQGRAFAWFDDELTDHDQVWLGDKKSAEAFRLLHVEPCLGLTSDHIAKARAWFQVGLGTAA